MQSNQSGYYSMQCICGFWSSAHMKPQSQWTDEEVKQEVAHQQFHLTHLALSQSPAPGQSPP